MIFRNKVLLVLTIGLAATVAVGIGILVTHISRENDKVAVSKYFNTTDICIGRYDTIPGTCTYCYPGSSMDPMDQTHHLVTTLMDFSHMQSSPT